MVLGWWERRLSIVIACPPRSGVAEGGAVGEGEVGEGLEIFHKRFSLRYPVPFFPVFLVENRLVGPSEIVCNFP